MGSGVWSYIVSSIAKEYDIAQKAMAKFTITFTFLQAPILLLLTLRTNRALDRLLESRRSWGALNRSTRSLMGLTCTYILPKHPHLACIIGRHLCICGWVLKGMIRNEDDTQLIRSIMNSVPFEADWIIQQSQETGVKRPHAVIYRLRQLYSRIQGDVELPSIIMLRIEEIIYDIESTIGLCNRIITSPIPPTYTRHTSRVLVLYLSLLPLGRAGMGIGTAAVVVTVSFAAYVLIGIDEIGLEIENPFGLMPLWGLSTGVQKEIERQVKMSMPVLAEEGDSL